MLQAELCRLQVRVAARAGRALASGRRYRGGDARGRDPISRLRTRNRLPAGRAPGEAMLDGIRVEPDRRRRLHRRPRRHLPDARRAPPRRPHDASSPSPARGTRSPAPGGVRRATPARAARARGAADRLARPRGPRPRRAIADHEALRRRAQTARRASPASAAARRDSSPRRAATPAGRPRAADQPAAVPIRSTSRSRSSGENGLVRNRSAPAAPRARARASWS